MRMVRKYVGDTDIEPARKIGWAGISKSRGGFRRKACDEVQATEATPGTERTRDSMMRWELSITLDVFVWRGPTIRASTTFSTSACDCPSTRRWTPRTITPAPISNTRLNAICVETSRQHNLRPPPAPEEETTTVLHASLIRLAEIRVTGATRAMRMTSVVTAARSRNTTPIRSSSTQSSPRGLDKCEHLGMRKALVGDRFRQWLRARTLSVDQHADEAGSAGSEREAIAAARSRVAAQASDSVATFAHAMSTTLVDAKDRECLPVTARPGVRMMEPGLSPGRDRRAAAPGYSVSELCDEVLEGSDAASRRAKPWFSRPPSESRGCLEARSARRSDSR